jgi:hypothetical protein
LSEHRKIDDRNGGLQGKRLVRMTAKVGIVKQTVWTMVKAIEMQVSNSFCPGVNFLESIERK